MEGIMKNRKTVKRNLAAFLAVILLLSGGGSVWAKSGKESEGAGGPGSMVRESLSREGYKLEQAVVLGRNQIHSPFGENSPLLDAITPNRWFSWGSDPGSLSMRGGNLEAEMGQSFRKWLEGEGLFPKDYVPQDGEVWIYADGEQRTISSARFFTAGLLPVGDTEVYHAGFGAEDPIFDPVLTCFSEEYRKDAEAQVLELCGEDLDSLSDNYALLSDVIDMEEAPDYKMGKITGLYTGDTKLILEEGEEPGLTGSLKTASTVSDALILQYYETDDDTAAFGRYLTRRQWEKIAKISDLYRKVLFSAPIIAVNAAHPLLQEIRSELNEKGRRFSFFCGHDSNISSVLGALFAEDYELPDSIEKQVPVGCSLVFCRWKDKEDRPYISVDMVYQTTEQLRRMNLQGADDQPAVMTLGLEGLQLNEDGLYSAGAFKRRLDRSIEQYKELKEGKEPYAETETETEVETEAERERDVKAEIDEIMEHRGEYPDQLIHDLERNAEMVDFVKGYLTAEKAAHGGLTEEEKQEAHPLFLQWDERWGYQPYGGLVIATSGCGPTALSMVLYSLTRDEALLPGKMADIAMNGYYVPGAGTAWSFMSNVPPQYGVSVSGTSGIWSRDTLEAAFKDGAMFICSVYPGDFTETGHFIVLCGMEDHKLLINDPFSRANSSRAWDYDRVAPQVRQTWKFWK